MHVEIRAIGVDVSDALREHVEKRTRSALDRLASWVHRVTIFLQDINGPRGGRCKQCRVVVFARRIGQVVITETRVNAYAAVTNAVRRAAHSLGKNVTALRKPKRGRRSKPAAQDVYEVDG